MNSTPRLFFLDWLRILAFGLLVPYHVGMYYVSWDWHVKSPQAGPAIEPLMLLSGPWRLSLLFFIAGAATQALLRREPGAGFVAQRSRRLLWPLAFGMLLIVPPQAYFEVLTKVAYNGSYADFMGLYLRGYGGFCRADDCLILPTWNHLWFLPYLWVYGLIAWALARWAPRALDRLAERLPSRPAPLLLGLALPLIAAKWLLAPHFPASHDLVSDWYNHAHYLSVFLLGLLIVRRADRGAALWDALAALRWRALTLALASWALTLLYWRAYQDLAPIEPLRWLQRLLWGGIAWWAIAAACGFARRWLDHDGPWRQRLGAAVFCLYILHQTLIVLLSQALAPLALPAPAEGPLLIALTLLFSALGYGLARRGPALLRSGLGIAGPAHGDMPQRRQSNPPRNSTLSS
ncbi:acyltransferase family protein [Paucibacter sp. XJ19-41]|uniref:acyltransferase family protein n=1 Tax=Paucibacter sp. XJ19-41 TaxID=2927824 RepID=UPI00234B1F26|nr:acyltransferase [Paucibacter sp. XJ19-41]MDC6167388.1 acyltransferase [Paucibacter sp. XJ19-41]